MRTRIRWVINTVLAVAAVAGSSAWALDLKRELEFQIPSQMLGSALLQFSKQAGVQVLTGGMEVSKASSPGINGRYTLDSGLKQLLGDTGFVYRVAGENTVSIMPEALEGRAEVASSGVLLAQGETGEGAGGNPRSTESGGEAADAQGTSQEEGWVKLDEIVVTAQKRNERLLDVPVPVTVIKAETLVETNKLRFEDWMTMVPGLSESNTGGGASHNVVIRGMASGEIQSVAFTLDDVPLSGPGNIAVRTVPDLDPGDLASIEVLRGPQGTLYGASSLSGLIKYVSADPSVSGYASQLSLGTSSVSNGDKLGYNARGRVSGPLGEALGVSLSGYTRREPGYMDNAVLGTEGINEKRAKGGRLATIWHASEDWTLRLSAIYQDNRSLGSNAATPALGEFQQNAGKGNNQFDQRLGLYSATLKGRMGNAEITSATGYNTVKTNLLDDSTAIASFFGDPSVGVPYPSSAKDDDDVNARGWSQELRLDLPIGKRTDLRLGGFYTDRKNSHFLDYRAMDYFTGQPIDNGYHFTGFDKYASVERAVFSSLTYRVTDRFDLQVAGRQSWVKISSKSYSVATVPVLGGSPSTPVINDQPEVHTDFSHFDYAVTPRFKVSPNLMIYARAASGYRLGGPNASVCAALAVPCSYEPDYSQNYEVGLKGDFIEHKLFVDLSVYYIPWKDLQASRFVLPLNFIVNAGEARSQGVELSSALRPLEGLTVGGWVAWNQAELTDDDPALGQKGDRLPYSPEWSGRLFIKQDFPLTADWSGFVEGAVVHQGERLDTYGATDDRAIWPAYTKYDFSAGLNSATSGWSANLFVNNVTDKRAAQTGNPQFGTVIYIQPRTVGLSLTRSW